MKMREVLGVLLFVAVCRIPLRKVQFVQQCRILDLGTSRIYSDTSFGRLTRFGSQVAAPMLLLAKKGTRIQLAKNALEYKHAKTL